MKKNYKSLAPRWTKDYTQSHFRLHPLKTMLTYMDLFSSGGRNIWTCMPYYFQVSALGDCIVVMEWGLLEAFSWDSDNRIPSFTVDGHIIWSLPIMTKLVLLAFLWPSVLWWGSYIALRLRLRVPVSFPFCGRVGMLSWTWSWSKNVSDLLHST